MKCLLSVGLPNEVDFIKWLFTCTFYKKIDVSLSDT